MIITKSFSINKEFYSKTQVSYSNENTAWSNSIKIKTCENLAKFNILGKN